MIFTKEIITTKEVKIEPVTNQLSLTEQLKNKESDVDYLFKIEPGAFIRVSNVNTGDFNEDTITDEEQDEFNNEDNIEEEMLHSTLSFQTPEEDILSIVLPDEDDTIEEVENIPSENNNFKLSLIKLINGSFFEIEDTIQTYTDELKELAHLLDYKDCFKTNDIIENGFEFEVIPSAALDIEVNLDKYFNSQELPFTKEEIFFYKKELDIQRIEKQEDQYYIYIGNKKLKYTGAFNNAENNINLLEIIAVFLKAETLEEFEQQFIIE